MRGGFLRSGLAGSCGPGPIRARMAGRDDPRGDYLRGLGIAAWGLGTHNHNTAQADSINVNTVIKWNEYIAAVAKEQTREYLARKLADATKTKESYRQYQQQLPTARNGATLRAAKP